MPCSIHPQWLHDATDCPMCKSVASNSLPLDAATLQAVLEIIDRHYPNAQFGRGNANVVVMRMQIAALAEQEQQIAALTAQVQALTSQNKELHAAVKMSSEEAFDAETKVQALEAKLAGVCDDAERQSDEAEREAWQQAIAVVEQWLKEAPPRTSLRSIDHESDAYQRVLAALRAASPMKNEEQEKDLGTGRGKMRVAMIWRHAQSYEEARRILAASFTSVAEREAALSIRDGYLSAAPSYVKELLDGLAELVAYTDGEECADPDGCNHVGGSSNFVCSRCRLRNAVPGNFADQWVEKQRKG